MPRAANSSVDNDTARQRTAVMCALGIDGKYIVSLANQKHIIPADTADDPSAIGEFGKRNTFRQVAACRSGAVLSHRLSPWCSQEAKA
jgi:hypothetical protein